MLNIEPAGDFIFKISDGVDFLKIGSDGVCTLRGDVVEEDSAVWEAFQALLEKASVKPLMQMPSNHGFIFTLADGAECLNVSADGVCTVQGNVVKENSAVWDAFKAWLKAS